MADENALKILWIRGLTRLQTQIRVVNAFRHGVDGTQLQQATNNPNVQRVLQRQASLNKRLSTCSNMSDEKKGATDKKEANNEVNNKANNSASHTETAV